MSKTLIKAGVSVSANRRFVVPNDQELGFMRGTGQGSQHVIPLAVKIEKLTHANIQKLSPAVVTEKQRRLSNICNSYKPYKFVPYYQMPKGYKLTPLQLRYLEQGQQVPETNFITFYESHSGQSLSDFIAELAAFKKRNSGRYVIPVLDPSARDWRLLVSKAQHIIATGHDICGLMGRNYKERGWSKVMPVLKERNVSTFVFGVYPRMTRIGGGSEYSTLPAYFWHGADFVSHGMSWSWGKARLRTIDRDWIYRNSNISYEYNRAHAIVKTNELCVTELKDIDPRILARTIQSFRYFACP